MKAGGRPRVLTIEPRGGLCNRMRSIDGAVALSADTGMILRVVWRIDDSLGCPLEVLFQPVPGVARVETRSGIFPKKHDSLWLRRFLPMPRRNEVYLPTDVERLIAAGHDFRELRHQRRPHIRTGKRVHRSFGPARLFVPAPHLLAEVERLAPELGYRVGVHVRHGDHRPGNRFSTTEHFASRIEALIARNPRTGIFLATDDPEAETVLSRAFPGRILVRPKSERDRAVRRAIEEAVIDLFCLARTRRILGTEASSFSRMAAELGGCPLEIVTSRTIEELEW